MTGQIVDLENEIILVWEQLAQIIQKALSYHNILRYVRDGRDLVPVFTPPTIRFGNIRYTTEQETQRE